MSPSGHHVLRRTPIGRGRFRQGQLGCRRAWKSCSARSLVHLYWRRKMRERQGPLQAPKVKRLLPAVHGAGLDPGRPKYREEDLGRTRLSTPPGPSGTGATCLLGASQAEPGWPTGREDAAEQGLDWVTCQVPPALSHPDSNRQESALKAVQSPCCPLAGEPNAAHGEPLHLTPGQTPTSS